jgi:hypothetical protein
MFFHAENAAGLQPFEDRRQRFIRIAAIHPIVQIAECHDEIGGAGRRDVEVAASQRRFVDVAEPVLLGSKPCIQALSLLIFLAVTRRRQGNGVGAVRGKIHPQDVGPIAPAGP